MLPAISVENLSKKYQIGLREKRHQTFREAVIDTFAAPLRRFRQLSGNGHADSEFWALKDVSFEVQEGEVLGIIGRNGAGKSTLLKILSRITEPTSGRAVIRGRVASLLEVGTGFHSQLTGRENVYLNGAILGMTKSEIDRKFDEIVDFSGVEKFLDTPIKHYSSGMKVRLAFAVAAHLDPEILIIDEVLAVGDAEFQRKCLGKMRDVAGAGRTVLFVSHNTVAVHGLCGSALLLVDGAIAFSGTPNATIDHYLSAFAGESNRIAVGEFDVRDRRNSYDHDCKLINMVRLINAAGVSTETFHVGQCFSAIIGVSGYNRVPQAHIGILVKSQNDDTLASFHTGMKPPAYSDRSLDELVTVRVPKLPFVPGHYYIDVSIAQKGVGRYDYVQRAAEFRVDPFDVYGSGLSVKENDGVVFLDAEWEIAPVAAVLQEHA